MTSLTEPSCSKRECANYIGEFSNTADTWSRPFCRGFISGIPHEIAYGDNLHLKPLKKQGNNFVYERRLSSEEIQEIVKHHNC